MKKFFVGFLSLFCMFGAVILTACGGNNVELSLSTEFVSIQLVEGSTSEQTVTVTVSGTDDTSIHADARGYEDKIDVRPESVANGRTIIYITGKEETTDGYAEVQVRTLQGNVTKVIYVDVYSQVSSMEQKEEETTKKNNYAIRGDSIELIENNLLTFYPSQNSRRTITWTLAEGTSGATIDGNILTIDSSYNPDLTSITLIATTELGVSAEVELPVVDKIEEELALSWSYSRDTQGYELINSDNNTFTIVPNIASDLNYIGYVKLQFNQELDVRGYALHNGSQTNDLVVEADGKDNDGNKIFSIYSNKALDNSSVNLNRDFTVYFEVGYSEFDYSISTLETNPIHINVREKVNGIVISSEDADDIKGTTQVLYSEYSNSYGQEYLVQVTPTTVIGATSRYSISLRITNPNIPTGGLANGCPVEFWYQDVNNNNIWTQIPLEYDSAQGIYTTRSNNTVSVNRIFMKASSSLNTQNFEGIEITFRSEDNPDVTNTFYAQLVKSVSYEDFVFEDADFRVDSSASATDVNITKTFVLQGQTSVEGLYIVNNSDNVLISDPAYITSTSDSVTFSITLTLRRESYGITSLDSYQICHRNGLQSELFDIDIFLPLKDAAVLYDVSDVSDSVTDYKTNNYSYDSEGNVVTGSLYGLSSIMIKNGSTTPVLYSYNTSGVYQAQASIDVSYYDFVESDTMDLATFKALISSQAGIMEIINASRANIEKTSDVAYFAPDYNSIITRGVGFTYAVLTFTGKGALEDADANGNVTIVKIVLIESYISPSRMNVTPLSDSQVNLYASDTVATRDEALTKKTITINFANSGITYKDIENFEFVSTVKDSSGNPIMTNKYETENSVSWENGRYSIDNITITDSFIRFDIVTNSNFGSFSFFDELEVHYQLLLDGEDGETEVLDVIWTTLNITIRNAQRVTSLIWENSDDDGIYFEIGERDPYYIVLSSSPTTARNSNVTYLVTDEDGTVLDNDSFISVDNEVSSSMVGLSLSDAIVQGTSGYVYLLPEDAVYNQSIIYNYIDTDGIAKQGQISVRALGSIRDNNQTWFDYLTENAFFLSNTSLTDEAETVYFADILIKIKVTVADGTSFDYAYRIYDEDGFNGINPELYYTVMNSLSISNSRSQIPVFNGGLQGYNDSITINLNGNNFAGEIGQTAEIRNITFSGDVTGQGFVANVNNGTINNVTLDVNQTYSSTVSYQGTGFVGGLVGVNNGTITTSSVLGTSISASNSTVGGIAGQNNGSIENSRVEFYNLADRDNIEGTLQSSFVGGVVGGVVGQANDGSVIDHTYAYNYNIDTFTTTNVSVLLGTTVGAIAGQLVGESTIYYSFAVIDGISNYAGTFGQGATSGSVSTGSDFYWSYYSNGEYNSEFFNSNSANLIASGENFHSYVNNGFRHFRDLYQDEKVTDVTSNEIQTTKDGDLYKSLAVDSTKAILFIYQLEESVNNLSSSEQNDLNELNTISLSQIVGSQDSDNLIITSSDTSIIRIIGNSISILKSGDVTLTISSKHDVSNQKNIDIKVIPAMSQMIISYTDNSGYTYNVEEGSVTYLQKTKSRDFTFGYEVTGVYLGSQANRYTLAQNDINLTLDIAVSGEGNAVSYEKISNSIYKITANNDSGSSQLTFNPIVVTDDNQQAYQDAINSEFSKSFTVNPVDGVISFYYSGESIPLTPSTNGAVRVEVQTTAQGDRENLRPEISYNNDTLIRTRIDELSSGDVTIYRYTLASDYSQDPDNYILSATVTLVDESYNSSTGIYSFIFEVSFSVFADYRMQIDRDMTFNVSFISDSESDSLDTTGSLTLTLTKQNFTSVDMTNFKVERSVWELVNGSYATTHTRGAQVGVVSPGSSSIMQITANPSFAHYDYVELSYSGSTVSSAVNFELLSSVDGTKFVRNTSADVETRANTIRFTPSDTSLEKANGIIYFRVAVSSTVNVDTVLQFTASFYESEGNLITSANYYLTVSYLAEPTVTIDGLSTAYLAVGSSVEVVVQVQEDQVVDSLVLDGDTLQGITISSLSEPTIDPVTRIKTYTATLNATVNASVGAPNNSFTVLARVSRTLNGVQEQRTALASVVLVDFKLDQSNIQIANADNGQLQVWVGVSKQFDVEYGLLPETYNYDQNDTASVERVQELLQARADFAVKQYYVSTKTVDGFTSIQYAINYDIANDTPIPLSERLFYVVDGSEIPVTDNYASTAGARFDFIDNDDGSQEAMIIGTRLGESVQFKLETYITLGDGSEPTTYSTYFTVTVAAYSDPDIPLTISSASEFENLNPSGYSEITQNDYILTNDIVLENHQAFNTSLIRSLDGNGYTIYIKSFATTTTSSTLNISLFNEVLESTTLKNVRVNIYNGGQLTLDLAQLANNVQINVAGLAITNSGTITNSEVVSFYTEETAIGSVANVNVPATVRHSNPSGFNVQFIRGSGTTEYQYVNPNSTWIPSVAGFVLNNSGSITNSRVGGDSITILGSERLATDAQGNSYNSGYTYASELELGTFYIIGQGDIAGFVLSNTGSIASSFAKQLDMENQSNTTTYDTSGFVNSNSGSVITSYVEGVKNPESYDDNPDYSKYAYEGSSLKSNLGIIAGFVNNNTGNIKDSYSNILISNSSIESRVYLAAGFVYENSGTIETCYSASQIQNFRSNQMNFSGITADGEPLAYGNYINCYFFNKLYYGSEDDSDNTTESLYATGAVLIPNPELSTYFYGFAIADGTTDGIWSINEEDGIKLIEPDIRSYSHRYVQYIDENSDYTGTTGQNDIGEYILPYATLQFTDSSREINTALGSANNPILIADAEDFVEVTGTSISNNINSYFNDYSIWGTYRLVSDIDLSTISESISLPSVTKAFSGTLYGNGFTISNLSIASERSGVSYGLFASMEKRNASSSSPLISNLNLEVDQVMAGDVSMVGSIAGYIKDSIIVSVEVIFNEESTVTGLNFVGGLVGLSFGDSKIKNIVVTDPNVVADRFDIANNNEYLTASTLATMRNNISNNLSISTSIGSAFMAEMQRYSYAGSVVGFADHFVSSLRAFNVTQASDYSINNIRVSGIVYVQGQVAGGVFGLTGYQTHVRDAGIDITASMTSNQSHIIATKYFAGGVIGQSFGGLSRIYSQYDSSTQDLIENNYTAIFNGDATVERGATDIFYLENNVYGYSQMYIGGLVGYAGSGRMEVSYSKLNVVSLSASYAGGIFGAIDLTEVTSYQAESELISSNDNIYTKYLINEVYASGDVRARQDGDTSVMTAGGIIGVSYGLGNRITMLAVNAVNQILNYDYTTDTYIEVYDGLNISHTIKTNLILGAAYEDMESTTQNILVDDVSSPNHYANYLNLVKLSGSMEGSAPDAEGDLPSVAYYEYYGYNGNRTYLNIVGNITGQIGSEENTLYSNDYVYAIATPSNYSSASVGHQSTQQAFLNSGVWVTANWVHPGEDLLPTIRYQRVSSYIYLDDYAESVENAFNLMQSANSDYTIVVRGRTSPDIEDSYSDINLEDYRNVVDVDLMIRGFQGSLIGSNEYITTDSGNSHRVKIISNQSFIASTGPGFYLNNVVVEYVNAGGIELTTNTQNTAGLFSMSSLNEATIISLDMTVSSPVEVTNSSQVSNAELMFGLLAPSIESSSISNVEIKAEGFDAADSLVTINVTDSGNDKTTTVIAGLIAGEAVQASTYSILQLDGINITTVSNYLTIDGNNRSYSSIYTGGYFGRIVRTEEALETRMNISSITRDGVSSEGENNPQLNIVDIGSVTDAYIGGYVGYNNGLDYLGAFQDGTFQTNIDIVISSTAPNTITNLYTGLIFGAIGSSSTLNNVNLYNSNFDGGLFLSNNVTIANMYAGGFAGEIAGVVSLGNITSINYQVADIGILANGAADNLSQDSFNSDDYDDYTVNMNGNAYVGGIAGRVETRFTFTGGSSSFTRINENGEAIRLSGSGDLYVGSIIGYVNSTVSNTNDLSLNIYNNIVSNANFVVVSGENPINARIGGMIGYISGGDTVGDNDSNSRVAIGSLNNATINYIGAAYLNAETINFGGIVGNVAFDSPNDIITLTNTVYGGALKVFGEKSNGGEVVFGGSIGYAGGTTNVTTGYNLNLLNNYNYGDAFVEYDTAVTPKLTALDSYTFGGLIGTIESSYRISANNNYSLVTSHNTRYEEGINSFVDTDDSKVITNNALFGNGVTPDNSSLVDNYYNYAVSLCHDELGIDIGYNTNYSSDGVGYNGAITSKSSYEGGEGLNMISAFNNTTMQIYVGEGLEAGHKLNPIAITSTETVLDATYKFNGMTYFYFDTSASLSSQLSAEVATGINEEGEVTNTATVSELENIAIIGNSREISYYLDTNTDDPRSMIETLSGFSYVSGLVVNSDVNIDDIENSASANFAGLANSMYDNALVYAVQIKGTISVGDSRRLNVGGIVANMYSGKILDSSTAVDITYRGGRNGNVYGLAGVFNQILDDNNTANGKQNKLIINSYSTGSITSYISSNLYALTDIVSYTKVINNYTIAKLDLNDYTISGDPTGEVSVFGVDGDSGIPTSAVISNSYYDYNGVNYDVTEEELVDNDDYDYDLRRTTGTLVGSDGVVPEIYDVLDYDKGTLEFNYGYPTHKYGFMKLSSFATISSEDTNSQGEGSTYDDYVIEREYQRLPNNTSFASYENKDNLYFLVTNAGQLARINTLNIKYLNAESTETTYDIRRYALMYDIDIDQTQYSEGRWISIAYGTKTVTSGDDSLAVQDALIDFDGQEHTIEGLQTSLFTVVGSQDDSSVKSNVMNLRLTDVTLTGKGALAQTIYSAKVYNMTLSGFATTAVKGTYSVSSGVGDTSYGILGGLANDAFDSDISTITNLIKIDVNERVSDTEAVAVGGIVGYMVQTNINYSSNYGPINVAINGNSNDYQYYVGGLVGRTDVVSTINYSYNATSVMAGYATSTSLSTAIGDYYVGGLVGYSNDGIEIEGSYNSGAIKSGNKSNGATSGRSTNGVSYGGGIVAYATYANITECYNEGTVESLGTSPTTKFVWEMNGSNNIELVLCQTSQRNVWAYAMGYLENGTINNCSANNPNQETIYMNGTMIHIEDNESQVKLHSWTWDEITAKIDIENIDKRIYRGGISWADWQWSWWPPGYWLYQNIYAVKFDIDSSFVAPTREGDATVYINAYNSFGLPSSFVVPVQIQTTIGFADFQAREYDGWVEGNWQGGDPPDIPSQDSDDWKDKGNYTVTNAEYSAFDYSNSYNNYISNYSDSYIGMIGNTGASRSGLSAQDVKYNTRSAESPNSASLNMTIAGENYYRADANNVNSIFNAGIYQYEIEAPLGDIPYVNNTRYYSISNLSCSGVDSSSLSASVTRVTEENVYFTIYSYEKLSGNINYTIEFDYSTMLTFDLSNLSYYYVDSYSFGITVSGIGSLTPISGYTIRTPGGRSYTNVVIGYRVEIPEDPSQEPSIPELNINEFTREDFEENYLFFAVEDEMLVYIPNATLMVDEEIYNVNKETLIDDNNFGANLYENLNNIINARFANQTYVFTTMSDEEREKEIGQYFGNLRGETNSSYINMSGSQSGSADLEYGADVNNWYSSSINSSHTNVIYSNSVTISLENIFEFIGETEADSDFYSLLFNDIEIYRYVYNVTVTEPEVPTDPEIGEPMDPVIDISEGWEVIASEPITGTINYNSVNYTYSIGLEDGKIVLNISYINLDSSATEQLAYYVESLFKVQDSEGLGVSATDYISIDPSYTVNKTSETHTFTVNLNTLPSDSLVLSSDDIPLLSYSVTSGWGISNSFNQAIINGRNFNVSLSRNSLTFTLTDATDGDYIALIRNYLQGLYAITNSFSDGVTLSDFFSSIVDGSVTANFTGLSGTLTLNYSVDKTYEVDLSSYPYLRYDETSRRIYFDGSVYDGLDYVELNGVRVYTGEITNIEYTQSYQRNITSYTLILNDGLESNVSIVYEISIGNYVFSEGVTGDSSTEDVFTVSRGRILTEDIGEGLVRFGASVCPAYELQPEDTETISVVLENNSSPSSDPAKQFIINATLDETHNSIQNNDIKYYVDDLGTFVYLNVGISESGEISFIIKDSAGNIILMYTNTGIEMEDGSILEPGYYAGYDSGGDQGSYEIQPSTNPLIYTSIEGQSIRLSQMLDPANGYMPYITDMNILGLTSNDYIYVRGDYTPIDELNGDETTITAYDYQWSNEKTLSELRSVSSTLDILYSEMDGFDFDFDEDGDVVYLRENQNYNISEDADGYSVLNFFLNRVPRVGYLNVQITGTDTITSRVTADPDVEMEPAHSIILFSDISFNNIAAGFRIDSGVNIIGNGYYISYFGTSLFKELKYEVLNNSFIKDIKFLAESGESALIFSGNNYDVSLINIDLYGTKVEHTGTSGAIINYSPLIFNINSHFDYNGVILNIRNFANINSKLNNNGRKSTSLGDLIDGLLGTAVNDLTLFNCELPVEITNYGFISASNGRDGSNGSNAGSTDYQEDGGNGGSGEDGFNIILTEYGDATASSITNNGVLKTGNGGNGGAGGSSGRGEDQPWTVATGNNYRRNYEAGEAGDGGAGGEAGSVMINGGNAFAQESYIKAYNGIAGLEGAKGRDAFGGIKTNNNTDNSIYVRYIFTNNSGGTERATSYSKDSFDSLLDNNGDKENLVNNIFNLSRSAVNNSETKYPTDWSGRTYASLLAAANS